VRFSATSVARVMLTGRHPRVDWRRARAAMHLAGRGPLSPRGTPPRRACLAQRASFD
jgi:hypothetical protein